MSIMIWSIALIACIISFTKNKDLTNKAVVKSLKSLRQLSKSLLIMIIAVSFLIALIPPERLIQLFKINGVYGLIVASIAGAIITIPGPIAFPMAGSLLKMGAPPAILATFITTLTMVGLTTAPLEISYFGKQFTWLRQSLSFISAILIGLTMGVFL